MSAYSVAVQRHYMSHPFRFVIQHFAPNRAQRRAQGYRHKPSKKLIFDSGVNMPYDRYMALINAPIEDDNDA